MPNNIRINIGIMPEEIAVVLHEALAPKKVNANGQKPLQPVKDIAKSYISRNRTQKQPSADERADKTEQATGHDSADAEQGSVLVISRGDISQELFERRLCTYGIEKWDELASTETAVTDSLVSNPENICASMARRMREKFADYPSEYFTIPDVKHKTKDITKNGIPNISVARIGKGPIRSIFIQSPEMGFQSNLCEQYLRIIHESLNDTLGLSAPSDEKSTHCEIVSFGGGGSSYESALPGEKDLFNHVLSIRTYVDYHPLIYKLRKEINFLNDGTEASKMCLFALNDLEQGINKYSEGTAIKIIDAIKNIYKTEHSDEQVAKLFNFSEDDRRYYSKIEIMGVNGHSQVIYQSPPQADYKIAQEHARIAFSLLNHTNDFMEDELQNKLKGDARAEALHKKYKRRNKSVLTHAFHEDFFNKYIKNKTLIEIGNEKIDFDDSYKDLDSRYEEADANLHAAIQSGNDEAYRKAFTEEQSIKAKIDCRNDIVRRKMIDIVAIDILGEPANRTNTKFFTHAREKMEERLKGFLQEEVKHTKKLNIQMCLDLSFFGGTEEKAAFASIIERCCEDLGFSENLGEVKTTALKPATDVNMEDGIIAKTFGHTGRLKIARVHCDPFDIDDNMKNKFKSWIDDRREQGCDLDYYVAAVQWGLEGYNMDKMLVKPPAEMENQCEGYQRYAWSLPNQFSPEEQKKIFYRGKQHKEWCVIDPFWREISTDLLRDIISGKAFTETKDAAKKTENSALMKKAAAFYEKILESHQVDLSAENKKELTEIISEFIKHNLAIEKKPDRFKTWVRKNAWIGNPEHTLEDMTDFQGTKIDRAFYVSNNFPALKRFATRAFNESFHKMQPRVTENSLSAPSSPLASSSEPRFMEDEQQLTTNKIMLQIAKDYHNQPPKKISPNKNIPPSPIVKQNFAPVVVGVVMLTVLPVALTIIFSNPLFLIGLILAFTAALIIYAQQNLKGKQLPKTVPTQQQTAANAPQHFTLFGAADTHPHTTQEEESSAIHLRKK